MAFQNPPEKGVFLSYSNATMDNEYPLFLQATMEDYPTVFNINCINASSGTIIHVPSHLVLTSWPTRSYSTITPVTYEIPDGSPEQAWTFVPAKVSI
ncbi:hypothetical protein L218DRAFT_1006289 [Marasmius fiardii PR-910]|nr:hypothetical protein L218DRAFT_1006289 [Marasmius fiardii PR-910]